jgi:hypothetical protein
MYILPDENSSFSYISVPTKKHNARIFDFDRSILLCTKGTINEYYESIVNEYKEYVPNCINTRMPYHCPSEGACQKPNPKFDAFTVLGLLWGSTKDHYPKMAKIYGPSECGGLFDGGKLPEEVIEFIERHIRRQGRFNPLTTHWNWPYRMSRLSKANKPLKKGGNGILNDSIMSPVMDMLQDNKFFNYQRKTKETFEEDCENAFVYHLPMHPETNKENFEGLTCEAEEKEAKAKVEHEAKAKAEELQLPPIFEDDKSIHEKYSVVSGVDEDGNESWMVTLYPGTFEEKEYTFPPRVCAMRRQGFAVPVLREICDVITQAEATTLEHKGRKKAQIVKLLENYFKSRAKEGSIIRELL